MECCQIGSFRHRASVSFAFELVTLSALPSKVVATRVILYYFVCITDFRFKLHDSSCLVLQRNAELFGVEYGVN